MKLVNWHFKNLSINMIDIEGELFTTTNVLCRALGIQKNHLMQAQRVNKEILGKLEIILYNPKECLRPFKDDLLIKRLNMDTKLWSEAQMIFLSTKVCSEKSTEFILELIPFIKEHAVTNSFVNYVPREEFNELKAEMLKVNENLKSFSHGAKSTIGRMNNLSKRAGTVIKGNFTSGAL